ncbi:MAG TPA: hypothetical protein VLG50_07180 [Candidatus Saccharimonadales bacterium]|nr:hypothetical protein [Candidatus Saccharimonadales bacterium]
MELPTDIIYEIIMQCNDIAFVKLMMTNRENYTFFNKISIWRNKLQLFYPSMYNEFLGNGISSHQFFIICFRLTILKNTFDKDFGLNFLYNTEGLNIGEEHLKYANDFLYLHRLKTITYLCHTYMSDIKLPPILNQHPTLKRIIIDINYNV